MKLITHTQEAELFTKYLIKQVPTPAAIALYQRAMEQAPKLSSSDAKLLAFMYKHPHLIGPIDAALCTSDPNSEVRRRMYVMFSILEATPEFADVFLPKAHTGWYVFALGYYGVRAICKTISGLLVVKVVK